MLRFFIHRPIFSTVISLVIFFVGIIAIVTLPVAQFPQIVPPTVQVQATYNGADALTVAGTTTLPLEQQINGAENMLYMSSSSTGTGLSQITITFAVGTNEDLASVDVMNRVQQAMAQLPQAVQEVGVSVRKQSMNQTVFVSLVSPNGTYDSEFLTNYANIVLQQPIQRIEGVGQVTVFGLLQYAMRIWIDPNKLTVLGLSSNDVVNAVKLQNYQAAVGSVGGMPADGQPVYTLNLVTKGRLESTKEFEDIIVRAGADGAMVRLKDVARVELGSYQYFTDSTLNGGATATIGVYQLPDANAFAVVDGVRAEMERLKSYFPPGIDYEVVYDTTAFVRSSLDELVKTLIEAAILVLLVIFIFLQDWRATLIPMIAIPVAIVGTFAFMEVFGFSINTLTLLGLVLAIGLVVDDSIVVVENVYRQLELGAPDSRTAAERAMKEVAGPIIATSLVLLAVFIPAAFVPGITGQLYNQFALTIAFSITLSAINSLTLTPALCGIFLKKVHKPSWRPFVIFNEKFERFTAVYAAMVRWFGIRWGYIAGGFAGAVVLIAVLLAHTPTGFIPNEDQGWFMVGAQLPLGSSLDRTKAVSEQARAIITQDPNVANVIEINGYNLMTSVSQTDSAFIIAVLKPWDERLGRDGSIRAILERAYPKLMAIPEAMVFPFAPPPIPGLGNVAGFQLQLEDINSVGFGPLSDAAGDFIAQLEKRPEVMRVMTPFANEAPVLQLRVDRTKAQLLGVAISDVFSLLGQTLGQSFVNNFNEFGQVYNVMIQADSSDRMIARDAIKMYVRNKDGDPVPLSAFCTIAIGSGTNNATHYNAYNTVQVNGSSAPGYSSGDAIAAVEEVAKATLPDGIGYEWTGTTLQEIESQGYAAIIFMLSLVAVFLFLAAQYESWALPFNVLLAVAFAVLGALIALWMRGRALDTYAQIGLVMLVGLAAKNAILITEFAKKRREGGESILDAAVNASHIRLRPILMTSFAFILGIVPLVIATGAGANSRQSIGTVIIGGMLGSAIIDQLVVPVLFVMIENLRERFAGKQAKSSESPEAA
ncbi:MAG: multidrug efflux RND transporter permease subunit [Planctomycetota bacterium]|nr:multidrug efflux RND transporter permease subunit [Planctomycetota bacterium]